MSDMILLPAIDLIQGRCVRLSQGAFHDATIYAEDPVAQARAFVQSGAGWLHIVDLDGARAGAPRQTSLIARMVAEAGVAVQVGGGLRTAADISQVLAAGVSRVVVGSLAVQDPDQVRGWIDAHGARRFVLALDCRVPSDPTEAPTVAVQGWQVETGRSLWQVIDQYLIPDQPPPVIMVTDIGRDGLLGGPNLTLYAEIRRRYPHLPLQASGGVARVADLAALGQLGCHSVVVGRALYEGRFSLPEALAAVA